jgi:hypothetical protein|tara:strand:- start:372 stop:689 length:318 start_codon:yes stop_codon:yes gene_type:complete
MILYLLPVFVLTTGIFGFGAYFAGGYVFEVTAAQLTRTCLWLLLSLVVAPPAYFSVYMLAQPKKAGDPPVTPDAAAIPALWLAVLIIGILFGLWRARAKRLREDV